MTRRLGAAAAALTLAMTLGASLAACGGEDSSSTADPKDPYQPTGSPSVAVTLMDPPADYSTIEGEGYTISAPGEFQQQQRTSSNGEPMLVLEKPSQVPAVPQRVAVIRDVGPTSSAAEQSFALEAAKAAGGPQGEVERMQIDVGDDTGPAYLVTWKETRPSKGAADVEVTYWQLLQQAGDDLILNVVAFAPTAEFETSEVGKILRTFVAAPSSSA